VAKRRRAILDAGPMPAAGRRATVCHFQRGEETLWS